MDDTFKFPLKGKHCSWAASDSRSDSLLCSTKTKAPHSVCTAPRCYFHFLSATIKNRLFGGDDLKKSLSSANMFEMLEALHLLLTQALCLQSGGGPKGAPLWRPPHEAQCSHEARTVAGFDLLKQCGVEWKSPDAPKEKRPLHCFSVELKLLGN